MEIEKLIESVRLCGSTPKVDQCKQCAYWSGGDMSKCIPRMTTDAATALSTLQAENDKLQADLNDLKAQWDMYGGDEGITAMIEERDRMKAELEQVKRALAMMWYAYDNKAGEFPHEYEIEAMQEAENVLGPWAECMPKYLRRGQKED